MVKHLAHITKPYIEPDKNFIMPHGDLIQESAQFLFDTSIKEEKKEERTEGWVGGGGGRDKCQFIPDKGKWPVIVVSKSACNRIRDLFCVLYNPNFSSNLILWFLMIIVT